MADKNYFEFLDIPDGSGGSDRWHARDAEAQAGIAQVASAIGVDTSVEFVDLGLQSGTLWAKCNVGAEHEYDFGDYYKYGKGSEQYVKNDSYYDGTEDPLAAAADTAAQVMGNGWHMPTKDQFEELIANTTFTWEENFDGSGKEGGKFTAANGNYVFFPATGYYFYGDDNVHDPRRFNVWTSTPNGNSSAYQFKCYYNNSTPSSNSSSRNFGFTVRGVKAGGLIQTKADKKDTYTKTEVDTIVQDAQAGSMFQIYVDPTDMHLKGKPTGYGTFEVVNGHLILHQTE